MDKILNDILVSREKDNLVEYEKILQKSLDYMSSIENLDEKKIANHVMKMLGKEEINFIKDDKTYFDQPDKKFTGPF